MRFHLLAPPNAPTTEASDLDGFIQLTRRMASLLVGLGHHVTLYGAEGNDAPCADHVACVTDSERVYLLDESPYQYVEVTADHPLWKFSNAQMIDAIAERKQPRDMILTLGGTAQQPVTDAHPDLIAVEYSIGYPASYANVRVFESRAWQNWTYGKQGIHDGRFFDAVIPGWVDPNTFDASGPEDYVVYCGRLIPQKGLEIVFKACETAGVKLKVIGHGDPAVVTYGEYLGALPTKERNVVLAGARALLSPTLFLEPFGFAAVEAQMCGTPVIATNFGAYAETVEHGVSGFRCVHLGDFVEALHRVDELDRRRIRERAMRLYSVASAARAYQTYFERLQLVWDAGWYSETQGLLT